MSRFGICLSTLFLSVAVHATAGGGHMMEYEANLGDRSSLQRGARLFVNYCLTCHSAAYMRFNRLGRDLGITEDILKKNLMFVADKPGATMAVAMRKDEAERFFGVAPPDLSVIARSRGATWLYTYFMSFYRDQSRPFGVNNLQFKDVAMPHVLWELQGWQRPVYAEHEDGGSASVIDHLELETPGLQSDKEYARTVGDLVNFLVYLGEPISLHRYTVGFWVIIYLMFLLVIVYFLKKEYWRDVH